MVSETIIEKMKGEFTDGSQLGNCSKTTCLIKSIGDHISCLLNTKQGSIQHIPQFGVPDVAALYRGLPATISPFHHTILEMLNRYEARLLQQELVQVPFNSENLTIQFNLYGFLISGERVRYLLSCESSGRVVVEFKRSN